MHLRNSQSWGVFSSFFLDTYTLCNLWCKALCIVINFLVFSSICFHLRNSVEYLKRFLLQKLVSRSFIVLRKNYFLCFSSFCFFHLCFDGVHFQYSQVLVIFFLSKHSDVFMIHWFYSFCCFFFPNFHYEHGTLFTAKYNSFILAVILNVCISL